MDLPTYTNIWRIEKRLYKLYDFRLPQPVSVVYLGVLLGVFAVWLMLMGLLGVPFETPWHVVWLVPPFVIAFLATRPVIEGKRLSELVVSQVRYVTEARVYTRLAPEREPGEIRVAVRVWHRDPAAGPLPAPRKRGARSAAKAAKAAERTRARRTDRGAEAAPPAPRRTARQAPSLDEVLPASPNGHGARAHAGSGPTENPDPAPLWNGDQPAAAQPRAESDDSANWAAAGPYIPAEPPPSVRERVAEREAAFADTPDDEPWEWEPEPAEPRAADPAPRRVEPQDDPGEAERETAFRSARENGLRPGRAADPRPDPAPLPLPEAAEPDSLDQRRVWERDYGRERGTPRRGVGKKVLNYFGFALEKPATGSGTDPARRESQTVRGRGRRPSGHTGPIPGAARTPAELAAHLADYTDERSPDHGVRPDRRDTAGAPAAAYSAPEAAPEHRDTPAEPVPDRPEAAHDPAPSGDPAPDRDTSARRRAEEMMAAPPTPAEAPRARNADPAAPERADAGHEAAAEPLPAGDPDAPASPERPRDDSAARSGAFGRSRPWERRERSGTGSEGDPAEPDAADRPGPQRRLRGRIQGVLVTRRLERERDAADAVSGAGQEDAGSAAPSDRESERARERARAAAPPPRATGQGLGGPEPTEPARPSLRARRLQQRPHAAPWDLPTPLDSAAEQRAPRDDRPAERAEPASPRADAVPPSAPEPNRASAGTAEPGERKPHLQLDHGTGEHESLSEVVRVFSAPPGTVGVDEGRPGRTGDRREAEPEPAPEAAEAEGTAPGAAAEDAQPRAAREAAEAAAEPEPENKPPLQLDHGTGEHESLTEVTRALSEGAGESADEESTGDKSARPARAQAEGKPPLQLDHGTGEHESLTEVSRAMAAPEERAPAPRAASRTPDTDPAAPSAPDTAAGQDPAEADRPAGDPRPAAEAAGAAADTAAEREPGAEPAPGDAPRMDPGRSPAAGSESPHPAAADAPRIPDLSAPKPALQLDHGTGEHESLSDVANAAASAPPRASRARDDRDDRDDADPATGDRTRAAAPERPATGAGADATAAPAVADADSPEAGAEEPAAARPARDIEDTGETGGSPATDRGAAASADTGTAGPSAAGAGAGTEEPEAASAASRDDAEAASGPEPPRERGGDSEPRVPADRLEVLDRYLSHADTPPPPPPRFAEATGGQQPRRPVSWFADTPAPAEHGPADRAAAEPERARGGDTVESSARAESAPGTVPDDATGRERGTAAQRAAAEGTPEPAPAEDPRRNTARAPHTDPAPAADEASEQIRRADRRPAADTASEPAGSPDASGPSAPDRDTPGPAATGRGARSHDSDPGDGRRAAAGTGEAGHPDAPAKPPLELDHGTGEHESFGHVNAPQRTTAADLEAAEAAAIRARRRDLAQRTGSPDGGDGDLRAAEPGGRPPAAQDGGDPATGGERSTRLARTIRANPTGGHPSAAPGRTADPSDSADTAAPSEPSARPRTGRSRTPAAGDDNVFSRVAQNARRLSHLFGQTPPGTPPEPAPQEAPERPAETGRRGADHTRAHPDTPAARTAAPGATGTAPGTSADTHADKPSLQLDHGTGEQQRLGDTPNGTPSQRARGNGGAGRPAAESDSGATRGWRRLARVVTGGSTAAAKSDLPPGDIERLRTALPAPRTVVVLGCTGGAGQTVTTLMLGHTLAAYRDERVVAVDVNPGGGGLSRRVRAETPETLTSLLANAEAVHGYLGMRRYTSQSPSGLEVVSTLDDPYVQTLDDRDYAGLAGLLEQFYEVALLDPAATGVARALPVADGMVLVAPASEDAARAVAMTFEWLDGHGYAALRSKAVVVINGVSKRSLADVDAAEQVARGRCRAIVRVPWDDHLAAGKVVDTGALRATTRRAHAALGGVLMHGLAAAPGPGAGPAAPGGGNGPRRAPEARR
ncbi:MinD-like ATPase involved in chromosome partitioning or flagellar assembly [Streptomonospora nanhaiensis]|uniref:MinD-like ATPase involved in chromosome partitioning or flagellar assembly n=1 Tax=Streptomonospora nanhaiensis TaxID=1323731 RepID=A0A853BS87_9ACTN|nr:MinD-like ATPase involved in chromosome partitioning or flagellar assembly [Streptomonospora nanhaiensis]